MNRDFNIPFYIFEEIIEYIEKGKPTTKWNNIMTLLQLAKLNNRLTESQIKYIIDTYK